ncbi:ribose-phosphate pyrophosphokinase 3 [Cladophialophora yegresii CBS 114405]|uniref:ribose-phosphate diphosphokinase n=1 Tax=Cladophialophora yegresii CBS 114405 TaxID=1182544 RepID=W9W301_9EURO|nr:ribose-phosphate pyrophosphokinase 3 [Cladophialophora yegresii CBS 114405]EXJ62442.1 ribose-phosphate pyrophosphokinase 3 [Cladophialophora yegresii CBS 114405]
MSLTELEWTNIGGSHPDFAELVCHRLGEDSPSTKLTSSRFSNGETSIVIGNSVRGADLFIIQTAAEPVNDMLMELLITISACKTASARKITAVLPCFPYSRQDKKDRSRAPITAKLVANMLETAGCNHIITMDLHASQIQGFFNIPVDNLYAESAMVEYIRSNMPLDNVVIVSPDAGAAIIADKLRLDLALIHKERKVASKISRMILVGSVLNKTAVIVDDIADTCGTLIMAADVLKNHGAISCRAVVVHGFLSGPAIQKIEESSLERLVVTNTLPLSPSAQKCPKIESIDVSGIIAEAIRRTHHGES